MNSHLEYGFVLALCGLIPALMYFNKNYPLKGRILVTILGITVSSIPYLIWDVWATEQKHWSFNSNFISGFYFYNLPIEEVLFFFVIPFCLIFVWSILTTYTSWKDLYNKIIS